MALYKEQIDRCRYEFLSWQQFSSGHRWAKNQMARRMRYQTKLGIKMGKNVLPEKKVYRGYET